jgi:membrane protein YqaA with SNARE-associated domain
VVFSLCYCGALLLMKGWWWSVHVWTGGIVLAGLVGWLLSYLILPPQEPQATRDL